MVWHAQFYWGPNWVWEAPAFLGWGPNLRNRNWWQSFIGRVEGFGLGVFQLVAVTRAKLEKKWRGQRKIWMITYVSDSVDWDVCYWFQWIDMFSTEYINPRKSDGVVGIYWLRSFRLSWLRCLILISVDWDVWYWLSTRKDIQKLF